MALEVGTKGCYGLRAMIDLAGQPPGQPALLGGIATRLDVSEKYLHTLLTLLKNAGLVRSLRGKHGGFELTRPPRSITLLEILAALEGPVVLRACAHNPDRCRRSGRCSARGVWLDLEGTISKHLAKLKLNDLVGKPV